MEKYDFLIFDFYNQSQIVTNQCKKSFSYFYPNIYNFLFNLILQYRRRLFRAPLALILTARRENISDFVFEHLFYLKIMLHWNKMRNIIFPMCNTVILILMNNF